jgi:hypothetical protein
MDVKQLRELYEAAPFQPFDIVLPNGSKVKIDHPEFMAFSRDYRTLHFYPLEGGAWHIDIKLVTEIRTPSSNSSKQGKKKR